MDGAGGQLAVRHRLDQVARTEGHVAARVDAGGRGGEARRVDPDRPARGELDPVGRLQERQVGLLADGEDAGVGVERQHVLVVVAGAEAAVLVEDGEDAPQLDLLEAARRP